jgi:hypothetical protein
LHVLRRNSFCCGSHDEHAVIPNVNGQLAVHHNRAASNGCFRFTIHAFPTIYRADPAHSLGATLSTSKPMFFTFLSQMRYTGCFIWEVFEKVFRCHNQLFTTKLGTHNETDLRSTFKRTYILSIQ